MKHYYCLIVMMILFLLPSSWAKAQGDFVELGDNAMKEGLYKTAQDYYQKALAHNFSTPDLVFKTAEACRLSNDYKSAVKYYLIVENCPSCMSVHPEIALHLGRMYKCIGMADSALVYFREYQQTATTSEAQAIAEQEVKSCSWVLDSVPNYFAFSVKHENRNVNTEANESGAISIGDSLLLFSTMKEISRPGSKNAITSGLVLMQVYQSELSSKGVPGKASLNEWGINSKDLHTGNVAFDAIHNDIYFTRCESSGFADIRCEIYVSHFRKGKWQKPVKLGGGVNLPGTSSTHPTVSYLSDSTVVLYFSSNRAEGREIGDFNIYYAILENDKVKDANVVVLPRPINTPGNEITPFYDNEKGTLYFSSDWHSGFGGYDVFRAQGAKDAWQYPINLGSTLNSPANDLYFTVNTEKGDCGYFVSNRAGSNFDLNNTCCNDIYSWKTAIPQVEKKVEETVSYESEPLPNAYKGLIQGMLPISLYFHNDEPDPKSKLSTTKETYFQLYNRYMFMRHKYVAAFTDTRDSTVHDSICREVNRFFDEDVHGNCQKFEEFIELMIQDLQSGHKVHLTVEGYASPVHTGPYNFALSKRRIATIVNQFLEYKKGKIAKYMGSSSEGNLIIHEQPYGSSKAEKNVSTNRGDSRQSVYSVEASKERRVEILDYQYRGDDSNYFTVLELPEKMIHLGAFKTGGVEDIEVHLQHNAVKETELDFISVGLPNCRVIGYTKMTPGRDLVLHLRLDNRDAEPTPAAFLPITLRVQGETLTNTIFVEYELR